MKNENYKIKEKIKAYVSTFQTIKCAALSLASNLSCPAE